MCARARVRAHVACTSGDITLWARGYTSVSEHLRVSGHAGLREHAHRLVGNGHGRQELEPHPCGLQGHPIMGEWGRCRSRSQAKGQIRSEQEEAGVHQGTECPSQKAGQSERKGTGWAACPTPTCGFQVLSTAQEQGPVRGAPHSKGAWPPLRAPEGQG